MRGSARADIDPRGGRERDRRRPGDHVALHPAVGVELGDGEERADPLAAVGPRLAERELDVAVRLAEEHVVRPVAHVAGVDERAQLRDAPGELAAPAVVAGGPLDRELEVVGHERERRVGIGPVEGGEVALEERHAATLARCAASGATPSSANARSVKKSATRSSGTIPFGRYQCQMLLYRPRMARVSSRGSLRGIAPLSIARARKLAHTNSRSRVRARADWRASSSRGEPLRPESRPCSATSTRLRWTSCSDSRNVSSMTPTSASIGSPESLRVNASKRSWKPSRAWSMIT